MRKPFEIHTSFTSSRTEYPATPTSSTILSLPNLERSIPVAFGSGTDSSVLSLAKNLAEIGLITHEDRQKQLSLEETVALALNRECIKATGVLQKIHLSFTWNNPEKWMSYQNDSWDAQRETKVIGLGNCTILEIELANRVWENELRIDSAIEHLNACHPNLGETIYAVLENCSRKSLGVSTYKNLLERFEYQVIRILSEPTSEDDEDSFYEGLYDKDLSEFIAENSSVKEAQERFPYPWVLSAKAKLSPYEIYTISCKETTPVMVKAVINAALSLAEKYSADKANLGCVLSNEGIWYIAQLSFFDADPTEQLHDDLINHEFNPCSDSYTESLHQSIFKHSDPVETKASWDELRTGLELLGALDNMLFSLFQLNQNNHDQQQTDQQ